MSLRSVLPIADVKKTGERELLFQNISLHDLAETFAKMAHRSGKQSDPYNVHLGCGNSCSVETTGWLQKIKSVPKTSSEDLRNISLV